ncbi:3-keto-disaccharide hydrolase [Jejuia spongiicola]|uniref:DUF1080 domain-containing protein n=1 Tax=Jejuia spongiicola TaxID=2942207 RepID=A0ABT0QHQ9_9FLAO|nr:MULTISPECIES: DUF1080 domain-containing protein [Flavobacteriaceae]MCL6296420.1 DUF1080 domain-containing protein [Jejuia spongiicola]PIA82359.1 hypothetical protein BFR04_11440 [Gaetbulibacter sp. 4G1]
MNKKHIILVLSIFFLFNCKNEGKKENIELPKKDNWVKLFNGKDLKDWTIKIKNQPLGENYKNTFIVENGVMKVNYNEYNDTFNESYGHIYYNKEFSNYKFRMQYRFTGNQLKDGAGWATRNSGVMVHCENPKNIGLNQSFPVSIEVQLLGGLESGERPTGNLCTPGTHVEMNDELFTPHCINSKSKTYNGDQWVNLEIEVRNDSIIKHFINGENVLSYTKPQIGGSIDHNQEYWKKREGTPLKKGYISLQSESHPVEFRNIEILEL